MFVVPSGVDVSSGAITDASRPAPRRTATGRKTGAQRLSDGSESSPGRTIGLKAGATGSGNNAVASSPPLCGPLAREASRTTTAAAAAARATITAPIVRRVRTQPV
jgi:hypothetical protein